MLTLYVPGLGVPVSVRIASLEATLLELLPVVPEAQNVGVSR